MGRVNADIVVVQLGTNRVLISVAGGPVWRSSSAANLARHLAAAATIRQGFSRFVLLHPDGGAGNRSAPTASDFARVAGRFGEAETAHDISTVMAGEQEVGSATQANGPFQVLLLKVGDEGYEHALDAKHVLGPDWERLVEAASDIAG